MATSLIRNKKDNSVILPVDGRSPLVFFPRGDVNGSDVLMADQSVIESVAMQEAVRKGLLEVVPEDEVETVLSRSDEIMTSRHEGASAATEGVIERKQDNTMVAMTCIGPGARPGLVCGAQIIRRTREIATGDAPPLCDTHEHLAHSYFQTEVEVESAGDGPEAGPTTKKVWKRMEMTAPQRNLAG